MNTHQAAPHAQNHIESIQNLTRLLQSTLELLRLEPQRDDYRQWAIQDCQRLIEVLIAQRAEG